MRRSERCLHSAAQVAKKRMRVVSPTLASVSARRGRSAGRHAPRGRLGPELLLVERQAVGADGLPVLGDDRAAPGRVVGHRDQPLGVAQHRPRLAAPALPPARRLGRDERAGLVEVDVEQAVQRHRAVGVRRGRIDEVDDDAGLLAAVQPHHAADALLVDAAAGRRREVHADRRARRVPALGEQLRVDEHVDVAALVGRERRRQRARRRAAADRAGAQAGGAHGRGHALGVIDAGRVDDARAVVEAIAVEHRGGHVERLVVERLGQRALVVVAADDRARCAGSRPA